jgi:UDP-GlcNAc:undecaprenyl-phosphate/decaprenyl-phosphate GlcNAc-1-phosphate transferase
MSFIESLETLVGDGRAVWGFLLAAGIVLALTPLTARLAVRIGAVDVPTDRPRVHSRPIPRIGGIAIVTAILVAGVLFVGGSGPYLGILIGTLGVAAVGLVDDVHGLRPRAKLLAVAVIALIPVLGFGTKLDHLTLPVIGDHDIGAAAYPLTVAWIAVLANLVNLIDGIDALASGIVAIAALAFALLAASFAHTDTAVLSAIVCGATLAFLRHNYHPARVFMGDTGALALGFLLAAVSVEGLLKTTAAVTLVAPLLVLAVPILDTSFVVLKRLKYRRPPWDADHNHFYHRFLRIGLTQRRTALYLHAWAALLAAYAILVRFVQLRPEGDIDLGNAAILGAAGLFVAATSVWMVYALEILKLRHLQVLRLKRPRPEAVEEREEAVERVLTSGRR